MDIEILFLNMAGRKRPAQTEQVGEFCSKLGNVVKIKS